MPSRIIQISDTHYFADPEGELCGVNTASSLQQVLSAIRRDPVPPALMLVTGDLSHDDTTRSYQRLAAILNNLRLPVYCLAGNHDDYSLMRRSLPNDQVQIVKQLLVKNWQIILLHSPQPGETGGLLAEEELQHLAQCLQAYPEHYALITLHHPPLRFTEDPLDRGGIRNAQAFWELLSNYPQQVRVILFGHLHQEYSGTKQNITLLGAPSTCDPIPPGYRWVDLYSNGQFQTGVKRIAGINLPDRE